MRIVPASLLVLGGIVLNVWVDRLGWIPTWALAVLSGSCYVGAAVMLWWPRWKAAWRAFVTAPPTVKTGDETASTIFLAPSFQDEIGVLRLDNHGQRETFAAQVIWVSAHSDPGYPISCRWKDSAEEKREILSGQSQSLQFLRAIATTDNGVARFTRVAVVSPTSEYDISPDWIVDGQVLNGLLIVTIRLSTLSGKSETLTISVNLSAGRNQVVREAVAHRNYY